MSLELAPADQPVSLFAGQTPRDVVQAATTAADALHDLIDKQSLSVRIRNREHVLVEGWQACGSLVGVFAVKDGGVRELPWPDTEPHDRAYGYAASYFAVKDGQQVGWGEGRCTRSEKDWAARDDFALSSMAQTRGQSRALRQPLGWVVSLAGYSATPAEEMGGDDPPALRWGPVSTDESVNIAIARLGKIVPAVDAAQLLVDLSNQYGGVPATCTRLISTLYDRWSRAKEATSPDPQQVYPEREPDRPGFRNTGD
jgi:hypothetical protein